MSDDLVKRLREVGGMSDDGATRWYINPDGPEAADRIEKLEAALDEAAFSQTLFDAVVGQRNKATDRIKKLEDELHHCFHRIEELQTALREIAYTEPEDKYWPGRIARKALEGKDD